MKQRALLIWFYLLEWSSSRMKQLLKFSLVSEVEKREKKLHR